MNLQTGQKIKLSDLQIQQKFSLRVSFNARFDVDISLFGLNPVGHLISDPYMVFFNNRVSPNREISIKDLTTTSGHFEIDLGLVDPKIQKLTLVATANQPLSAIQSGKVEILNQSGAVVATYDLNASTLNQEKALMLVDVYVKDAVWRLGVNGQGFNGGLDALVVYFGAEVAQEAPQQAPQPQVNAISLKKEQIVNRVSLEKPRLVDLTKKSLISLEKNNLLGVQARVCLVLDRSGSMYNQYASGDVQKIVDRVIPLALSFDDNGEMESWAFGDKPFRLDDVSLRNVDTIVGSGRSGAWRNWRVGAEVNNEYAVIRDVLDFYSSQSRNIPTYVIFISDGGVHDNKRISKIITEAASYPIFWQFVGIGGRNYGILEKLDTMQGRVIDNCNFFSLDRLEQISEEQLYDMLLNEFPQWLKEAKQKGILR
ncbi:vWA domain-containing protein [Acinetobacter sp. P1(2025)]|uniref:vWA domain-containing protein n=1 Tax=Acinetobacter sp. P1(2025) TaxID=3446120 RepID=UPI003F537A5D